MRLRVAVCLALAHLACGGITETDGGPDAAAPTECTKLDARVTSALELAKICDPSLDEPSCGQIVEGRCCAEVVNPDSQQAIADYEKALAEAKAAGCYSELCQTIDCAIPTTGDCRVLPVGTSGACEPVF